MKGRCIVLAAIMGVFFAGCGSSVTMAGYLFEPPEEQTVAPQLSDGRAEQGSVPQQGQEFWRWRAIRGTDLHGVLEKWCAEAGVRLLWQADRHYAIQESMVTKGHFEKAVYELLDQFGAMPNHFPLGQLYRGNESAKPVLIIRSYHMDNR